MPQPAELPPDVLRKRAERERRARLEAEAIAEKATLELYQAAESRRALLMSVGDAILAADEDGTITLANPAAATLLGRDEERLHGLRLHEAIHPAGHENACRGDGCALMQALGSDEAVIDRETSAVSAGGAIVPVAFTYTPIVQAERRRGSVLTLRDVSVRKQAEEARIQVRAQMDEIRRLEEVDGFKTNFINMAAHELRTPLTPILTELYLLRQDLASIPEHHRRSVEILSRGFDRMARLVEEVLEGARMQAGRLGIKKEPMDLAVTLNETLETFQATMAQRRVALASTVAAPLQVMGDAGRLTQVLTNLLGNAVKFTPEGGTVSVEARLGSGQVTVRVKDTGIGITKEQQAKLFRPFSQVEGHHQAAHDGAGLGLYICKGIVELHGGRIWVESQGKDKGSMFSFTLPAGWTPEKRARALRTAPGKEPS